MVTFGVIGWAINLRLGTGGELRNMFVCFRTGGDSTQEKQGPYVLVCLWGFMLYSNDNADLDRCCLL